LVFNAIHSGKIANVDKLMVDWDRNNRRVYHRASIFKAIAKLPRIITGKDNMYQPECLEAMLRETITDELSDNRLATLPNNIHFWVYGLLGKRPVNLHSQSEYKDYLIAEISRCFAAIPKLYGAATLGEEIFIDPVFSKDYRRMLDELKREAKPGPHIYSDVIFQKQSRDITYIKPHDFSGGKRMIYSDSIKLLCNFPNSRPYQSFLNAKL